MNIEGKDPSDTSDVPDNFDKYLEIYGNHLLAACTNARYATGLVVKLLSDGFSTDEEELRRLIPDLNNPELGFVFRQPYNNDPKSVDLEVRGIDGTATCIVKRLHLTSLNSTILVAEVKKEEVPPHWSYHRLNDPSVAADPEPLRWLE